MSTVGKAKPQTTSAEGKRKQSGIRWALVQTWYLRLLSVAWLVLGLLAWSVIIGADPTVTRHFEARATTFQAITIYFAIVDILAAVGLWLLAPWGTVVWLIAALSRLVIAFVFPAAYPMTLATAAAVMACVTIFLSLTWLVIRKSKA